MWRFHQLRLVAHHMIYRGLRHFRWVQDWTAINRYHLGNLGHKSPSPESFGPFWGIRFPFARPFGVTNQPAGNPTRLEPILPRLKRKRRILGRPVVGLMTKRLCPAAWLINHDRNAAISATKTKASLVEAVLRNFWFQKKNKEVTGSHEVITFLH